MQRLALAFLALFLLSMACTFDVQVFRPTPYVPTSPQVFTPTAEISTPSQVDAPTDPPGPAPAQVLEGPDINYNGIHLTLDPALGSRLYVFDDVISLDGATAHYTRFALSAEEYCLTWCVIVYPVAEFEQAFGRFVFPPAGYRGGAAIIFEAQKQGLSLQNGSGDRSLEIFGQSHYAVSNEALKYVFRGYSMDKQYGIYVQVPVHASNLPNAAPTMKYNSQDVLDYNQKMTESTNALTSADFTPSLDLLDALVASIRVGPP